MKKVLNLISWLSFAVTMLTVVLVALCVGSQVCVWIEDELHITGWWCFLLTPVDFVIAFAIVFFFAQGTKKMQWEK